MILLPSDAVARIRHHTEVPSTEVIPPTSPNLRVVPSKQIIIIITDCTACTSFPCGCWFIVLEASFGLCFVSSHCWRLERVVGANGLHWWVWLQYNGGRGLVRGGTRVRMMTWRPNNIQSYTGIYWTETQKLKILPFSHWSQIWYLSLFWFVTWFNRRPCIDHYRWPGGDRVLLSSGRW